MLLKLSFGTAFIFLSNNAFAENNTNIDAVACSNPAHNVVISNASDKIESFEATSLSVLYERVAPILSNQENSKKSNKNCSGDQLFLVLQAGGSLGDSDFSESTSASIGGGLRYYDSDRRLTIGFVGQYGVSNFEENDASIRTSLYEGSLAKNFSVCANRGTEGECPRPNKLIAGAFIRGGYANQESRRPDRAGNLFKSNFYTTGVGASLDYAIGGENSDPNYKDRLRWRAEVAMDDKIDSGEFDVNKIYSAGLSIRDTKEYRTKWQIGANYRWGSDDYSGFVISFVTDFSTWR